jgi:sec-independent protein translocase protein TatA
MGLDNPLHIALLVLLLLLVFGAKRLPEIGRSLGSGMREFKSSITGESHQGESHQTLAAPPANPAPQPAAPQQAPASDNAPTEPAQQTRVSS